MTIVDRTARMAALIHYHEITASDTAVELEDWLMSLTNVNSSPPPGGYVTDNEDGTFGFQGDQNPEPINGGVGDTVVAMGSIPYEIEVYSPSSTPVSGKDIFYWNFLS